MDILEMRNRNEQELRKELSDLLHEQFNLRMQKGTGQLTQPNELRRVRRDIARVKTLLNEKAREGFSAPDSGFIFFRCVKAIVTGNSIHIFMLHSRQL